MMREISLVDDLHNAIYESISLMQSALETFYITEEKDKRYDAYENFLTSCGAYYNAVQTVESQRVREEVFGKLAKTINGEYWFTIVTQDNGYYYDNKVSEVTILMRGERHTPNEWMEILRRIRRNEKPCLQIQTFERLFEACRWADRSREKIYRGEDVEFEKKSLNLALWKLSILRDCVITSGLWKEFLTYARKEVEKLKGYGSEAPYGETYLVDEPYKNVWNNEKL